jgi:hypothetical protein
MVRHPTRALWELDAEGSVLGDRPGKAWMLINFGAAGGISNACDDGVQLVIEVIVSAATDASSVGVARLFAGAVSGFFVILRRGRDVDLP